MFGLVSALYFVRQATEPQHHKRWYVVSLLAFACALLSKATAVTLPAVFLILNVYPLRRIGREAGWWSESARRAYMELIPFAGLSAAAGLLSIAVLQPGPQLPLAGKLAVSAYSLVFYTWKTIAPLGLSPLYPMPQRVDPTAPTFIVCYVVAIGIIVSAWVVRRRWAGVTAAIVAFIALAMRPRARAAASIGGVVLVVFGACTWRQCGFWQNSEVLWSRVLQIDSTAALAHNNLGVVLAEQRKSDAAIEHYKRAIEIRPTFADLHNNLGYELQ